MSIVGPLTKLSTNLEELIMSGWIDGASIKLVNDDEENGLFAMIEDGRIFCSWGTYRSDKSISFQELRQLSGCQEGLGGYERKTSPVGYICYRCKVPDDDSNYRIRNVKAPTGISKSMLMATPDGSYMLPSDLLLTRKLRGYLRTNLSLIFHQNFVSTMERSNERCCLNWKLLFQQFLR